MAVDTRNVPGRRELHFQSLDEVVADAERLAASGGARTLGNWPLERILAHLATTINGSIDGIAHQAPWFIRLLGPLFKRRLLTRTFSPGFRLPQDAEASLYPAASSLAEGLQQLRSAVARTHQERMTACHPVLGKLTHEEWTQLHLRHSELHLSYALPS